MDKTAYTVFRSDLMSGTDVGADLVSVRYCTKDADEYVPAAIENGSVVELIELEIDNREVWTATDVKSNSKINDVVVIGTPEVLYDERKKNLDEFINEAEKIARGYRLRSGNIFSITKEGFQTTLPQIEKGNIVELTDGNKFAVAATATDGATVVGKIIAVENTGRYTYYVIKID